MNLVVIFDVKSITADSASPKCFRSSIIASGLDCDVSFEASAHAMFKSTVGNFGKIDSVVASAEIAENYLEVG